MGKEEEDHDIAGLERGSQVSQGYSKAYLWEGAEGTSSLCDPEEGGVSKILPNPEAQTKGLLRLQEDATHEETEGEEGAAGCWVLYGKSPEYQEIMLLRPVQTHASEVKVSHNGINNPDVLMIP